MPTPEGFDIFDSVYCISLKRSVERREHMVGQFQSLGVEFAFIDAYDWDSPEVASLMSSGQVAAYPPCFRCKQMECDCQNKSLFQPQIGNWLSHKAAWQRISAGGDQLSLICEDDIVFLDSHRSTLELVAGNQDVTAALKSGEPLLIRLGWALCEDHAYDGVPYLDSELKMSNPCYAISASMASLLTTSLTRIETTSDHFIHEIIGQSVTNFTAYPPLAHDLSWSTGGFCSEIRPKQGHIDYLTHQLQDLQPGDPRYETITFRIRQEEKRIKAYEAFNEDPASDRWRAR